MFYMIFRINFSYLGKLWLFAIVLFVAKLIILPYVHQIDADAVSRVYLSLQFAENPHLIQSGNWPPVFFYIMGSALKLCNNQFYTPVFVNIVFSVLLLFPLFFILNRLFEQKISFLLCVFFSFSPIVFRMSMLAMSEISFLFFLLLSIAVLLKGLSENKNNMVLLAGIIMSIASGIRYESWFISFLIFVLIAYYKTPKKAFLFAVFAAVIPIYWLLSNYFYADNALNSFGWAINLPETNSINSLDSLLRRIWWYPLSLMFAFGPIAFYFFVKELRYYKSTIEKRIIAVVFILFFIIWLFNSLRGSLLLQHRFGLILFVISFPFLGFYLQRYSNKMILKTAIFSITAFLLAFVYSSQSARPIPRLLTKDASEVSQIINKNINADSGFICDFWNWETTYYLPFATGINQKNIEIIESSDDAISIKSQINTFVVNNKSGVILIAYNKAMYSLISQNMNQMFVNTSDFSLTLTELYRNNEVACYKYKVSDKNIDSSLRSE